MDISGEAGDLGRPLVKGLFVASCLLAIVSYYTTQQGMALYLSSWFSILAALGIQIALVLVAWLIGFTRSRRGLLIAVYSITAVVSIAFSYVSLYTWFSARERPALVQRQLYDQLSAAAAKTNELVSASIAEARKHVLALGEMSEAERTHGSISRAQDADPYLAAVREAVATEARTYSAGYREGAGVGVRYSAFDRYTKVAREQLEQLQQTQRAVADFAAKTRPGDPSEQQLRAFHSVYDAIPWAEVERQLHQGKLERPVAPAFSSFVDRSSSNQEDLMLAFQGLVTAPDGRHVFSLLLAAFIDVVIFLLAYASGPYFHGSQEQRWYAAGAALEAKDRQVFVRNLLRKLTAGSHGMAQVDLDTMTPGELQVCLLLVARGLAVPYEENGRRYYLIDPRVHEELVESIAAPNMAVRAIPQPEAS
ncbi:MAG: hypothetical protein ACKV22_30280 [Bryobacteraceae bacterium]